MDRDCTITVIRPPTATINTACTVIVFLYADGVIVDRPICFEVDVLRNRPNRRGRAVAVGQIDIVVRFFIIPTLESITGFLRHGKRVLGVIGHRLRGYVESFAVAERKRGNVLKRRDVRIEVDVVQDVRSVFAEYKRDSFAVNDNIPTIERMADCAVFVVCNVYRVESIHFVGRERCVVLVHNKIVVFVVILDVYGESAINGQRIKFFLQSVFGCDKNVEYVFGRGKRSVCLVCGNLSGNFGLSEAVVIEIPVRICVGKNHLFRKFDKLDVLINNHKYVVPVNGCALDGRYADGVYHPFCIQRYIAVHFVHVKVPKRRAVLVLVPTREQISVALGLFRRG